MHRPMRAPCATQTSLNHLHTTSTHAAAHWRKSTAAGQCSPALPQLPAVFSMQTRSQARTPPPQPPEAVSLGEAVLTNELVFSNLWSKLGRGDRRQLSLVSRRVLALSNESVEVMSQAWGERGQLAAGLARFPRLTSLMGHCDDTSLSALRAAPLTRLRKLDLWWPCTGHGNDSDEDSIWECKVSDSITRGGLRALPLVTMRAMHDLRAARHEKSRPCNQHTDSCHWCTGCRAMWHWSCQT
jgi:hypothetical protein